MATMGEYRRSRISGGSRTKGVLVFECGLEGLRLRTASVSSKSLFTEIYSNRGCKLTNGSFSVLEKLSSKGTVRFLEGDWMIASC